LFDQPPQVLIGGDTGGKREGGKGGAELLEAEGAALGDLARRADAGEIVPPTAPHLRGALEIPFAVGTESRPHRVESLVVPEAGQDVLDDATCGRRVVHVVRHHPGDAQVAGDFDELRDELMLLCEAMVPALDRDASIEDVGERRRGSAGALDITLGDERRHPAAQASGEREQSPGMAGKRLERDPGMSSWRIHPGAGDQRREVGVALARFGQKEQMRGMGDSGGMGDGGWGMRGG
jgi:hypothetical protein